MTRYKGIKLEGDTKFILGDGRFFDKLPESNYKFICVITCVDEDGYEIIIATTETREDAERFTQFFIEQNKEDDYWRLDQIKYEWAPLYKKAQKRTQTTKGIEPITPAELDRLFRKRFRQHPMRDYHLSRKRDTQRKIHEIEQNLTALQDEVKAKLLDEYEIVQEVTNG